MARRRQLRVRVRSLVVRNECLSSKLDNSQALYVSQSSLLRLKARGKPISAHPQGGRIIVEESGLRTAGDVIRHLRRPQSHPQSW